MWHRREVLGSVLKAAVAPLVVARRADAGLVRHPYVQSVGRECATIVWTTEQNGRGAVRYSEDPSFSRSATSTVREKTPVETETNSAYYRHKVELTGLRAGTEYYYRVMQEGTAIAEGANLSFRTPGSGPFTFYAFGDSGSGSENQRTLAGVMMRERPALVLHLGDLAYPVGRFSEYEAHYFAIYRDLMKQTPFFPCPGNHGYMTRDGFPFVSVHEVPSAEWLPENDRGRYYSYDWHNVHFVAIDSNAPLVRALQGTGPMLEWLEEDLKRTTQFWKIVYFHHPPYAGGPNENDVLSRVARQQIVPILERHGVQLVLNGHEHSYQRTGPVREGRLVDASEGVVYITSGGGGAGLYAVHPNPFVLVGKSEHNFLRVEVSGNRLTVRAKGLAGQELDSTELAPPPLLSEGGIVNAAFPGGRLAGGGLISIYGRQLAPEQRKANEVPLPNHLEGVAVTANGREVPLLFVSALQVNGQLPYDLEGEVEIVVRTANGEAAARVTVAEAAPGILAVARPDGQPATPWSPLRAGEQVVIYASGLGPVNGQVGTGEAAPAGAQITTRLPVRVQLSGVTLEPSFAGLAPGFPGLYQVNFQLPTPMPAGRRTLALRAGNAVSNTVDLPVA